MLRVLSTVALLACFCKSKEITTPCDVPNQHCDCTDVQVGDVFCSGISSIPKNLPPRTSNLDLTTNFIGPILLKIEVNHLANLSLHELYLNENKINAIQDNAFEMLYKLWLLDLSGNKIPALSDNSLVGLKNLHYLFLYDADLMEIPQKMLEQVPLLQYLDLEGNKLTTIGREFMSLQRISSLLLARNQITQITREAFIGLTSLTHLSLFDNKLNKPQSSWFDEIVSNNGRIEVDRRSNSTVVYPNPWLCCPDVMPYYIFLQSLSKSLRSYDDLNIACSWPVVLSGRLMNTLSTEELNLVPCISASTISTFLIASTLSVTTRTGTDIPRNEADVHAVASNFLGGLNDVGAFFILLLIAVVAAAMVAVPCYLKHNKSSRVAVNEFVMSVKSEMNGISKKSESQDTLTTRPYRQERASYGATLGVMERPPTEESHRESRASPRARDKRFSNVMVAETDNSEDEIWNAEEKRRPSYP